MSDQRTLYTNAVFHTMDPRAPRAEALLVQGNRILAVGARGDMLAVAPGAATVDLGGGAVVPGFNDSHVHILSLGLALDQIDLGPQRVQGIADVRRAVGQRAATTPEGEWITGRGYDQTALIEGRHPTRAELDPVSRGHPVVLWHATGHVVVANSAALALAGVGAGTADPAGGSLERDEHGVPTGVLKESAMDLVGRVVPPPDHTAGVEAIVRAMQLMTREGVTSASDAATGHGESAEPELAMYREALASGELAGRITVMPQIQYVAPRGHEAAFPVQSFDVGESPEWLSVGPTKIFSDGALSTRTAAVREPYPGTSDHGILLWDTPDLASAITRAHAAGWQIATHALGDRAVEVVLDCYAAALSAHPRADHRHRIEHAMLLDEALAARFGELGILPSLQPDIYRLGDAYIRMLGLERASAESIAVNFFRRRGITVAFSSDRPVISGHPLEVVLSAMERRTPAGITLGREHAVPALEAIRNMTWGGAYATHREQQKGSLTPGKLADFAVLSGDPDGTAPDDFRTLRVTMTVCDGKVQFAE